MIAPARVDQVRLWRLSLPLRVPYHLSLGEITAFDTVVVEVRADDDVGYGEATYLPGYSDESVETGWDLSRRLARTVATASPVEIRANLEARLSDAAFTVTAFTSALEMLSEHRSLVVDTPVRLPLLALLECGDEPALTREIDELIKRGFATLKVKVGFDVDSDLARIRRIQRANAGRCSLRLDANQGYRRDEAMRFAASLDPEAIELFEQPCTKDDWDSAVAVAAVSNVPLMLDESIYGIADIERAAACGAARFIKLKLMKAGSLDSLAEGLRRIRILGMEPILGNGVATDLSNWMEACVARNLVSKALESIGFLKTRRSILRQPLCFEDGAIVLEPSFVPSLDESTVEECALAREVAQR